MCDDSVRLKKKLIIKGKSEYISTKETKDLINFIGKELLGSKWRYVKIRLTYSNKLSSFGFVNWLDKNIDPRNFEIYINPKKQKKVGQIKTIIHELCHVKQMALGYLYDFPDDKDCGKYVMWYTKKVRYYKDIKRYRNLPWEKEARKCESIYYKKYKQHLSNVKILQTLP